MSRWEERPLELYVHIPFCVRKCAYCDFLSGPWNVEIQAQYVENLKREIRYAAKEAEGRRVSTVFVGGGTPSLLNPSFMESILQQINRSFDITPDAEITIEANPGTLCKEQLQLYREIGINRLSIGLQSTRDVELQMLGRIHDFQDFLRNFAAAREAGFDNISVDLMFALPKQTRESWRETLIKTAELSPEHLSAYSLIIEEGTPFASMNLELPEEDVEYEMYEDTRDLLEDYGYHQYEISNYARPGKESRHNLGYWERTDYLGLGLGASSLWTPYYEGEIKGYASQMRFSNTREMGKYLAAQGALEPIREEKESLSENSAISEFMFLGLRKMKGVSKKEFYEQFQRTMEELFGDTIRKYCRMGMLEETGESLCLTQKGIHVSNRIMADFLLDE